MTKAINLSLAVALRGGVPGSGKARPPLGLSSGDGCCWFFFFVPESAEKPRVRMLGRLFGFLDPVAAEREALG